MSTKEKELKYTFATEKSKLIEQCIQDITNFGYELVSRTEEGKDTKLVFELKED